MSYLIVIVSNIHVVCTDANQYLENGSVLLLYSTGFWSETSIYQPRNSYSIACVHLIFLNINIQFVFHIKLLYIHTILYTHRHYIYWRH